MNRLSAYPYTIQIKICNGHKFILLYQRSDNTSESHHIKNQDKLPLINPRLCLQLSIQKDSDDKYYLWGEHSEQMKFMQ